MSEPSASDPPERDSVRRCSAGAAGPAFPLWVRYDADKRWLSHAPRRRRRSSRCGSGRGA